GIGVATGLPAGVTAAWAANVITISGTPTASGVFAYSIPLTGGCGSINATGTITVTANMTAAAASSTPTLCISTPLTNITHATTLATGIGVATGLPAGVTAAWAANVITISGTPTASGVFAYSIPLTGGCGSINATGTITVTANMTAVAASSTPTLCISTPLTNITHATTLATGIGVATGLPAGITAAWAANVITISGTPTVSGVFAYSIPLTGGCGSINATGTITVDPVSVGGSVSGGAVICSGSTSGLLTLSGHLGTVVRWESAVSPFSSWTSIVNTATTYTSGVLTQDTQFRAVIQSGICSIANSTATTVALGNTTTWNGSAWTNGAPTSTSTAVISGNYVSATDGGNIDACSLTLTTGTVVISSGDWVTLSGALIVTSGSFTLENNANLIQGGVANTNSGNIIVKRNSSSLYLLDYTLWSSPVLDQNLYDFSPNTVANRFYYYDSATDFYTPISAASNFNVGQGYLIRVPRTFSPTVAAVYNGVFTGKPNSGDITYGMNLGFNAVGNPYPSQINVYDFIDQNLTIDGTLYFWRKKNNSSASSYATLTELGYVANAATGGDTGSAYFDVTNPSDWVVNVGQGFIVNAVSASNLVFNNAMRRGLDNSNQFFRNSSTTVSNASLYWLNLTNPNGLFNQLAVGYVAGATLGVDRGIDGLNNNTTNYLCSVIGGTPYAIQGRPEFLASDIVPLELNISVGGKYSIAIDHLKGLFQNQAIFLKDNETNTIHDLKTGSYSFISEVGVFKNRFEIVYQNALAVNQTSFNENNVLVYKQNQEIVINAGKTIMSDVKVYDIRGRLLLSKDNINATQTKLFVGTTQEVLIVKIGSGEAGIVTKKVIN
ncbi:T9SS sorting signal type C domain-containing protein, partial [Flavobacterium psychrotolerans]